MVSSNVETTTAILWNTIQIHEVMAGLYKHKIKRHPSITSIFVCFLIKCNISEPLQEIFQIKRDITGLNNKSDCHNGRMTKPEYLG